MPRSMTRRDACRIALTTPLLAAAFSARLRAEESAHPLDAATREQLRDAARREIEQSTATLAVAPDNLQALSRRGDARFFLSQFEDAVADFDAMLRLDPALEASHWRRGIALFYAKRYDAAAGQFERYHTFDNVDRENGIWRFLCQTRSVGLSQARESLLRYEKDDREPFPAVFRLFAGTMTEQEILNGIAAARIDDSDRQSRRFYADLYIGLNHAVQDRPNEALAALARATKNDWPRTAGYGPRWMWHVGRVHWELLNADMK